MTKLSFGPRSVAAGVTFVVLFFLALCDLSPEVVPGAPEQADSDVEARVRKIVGKQLGVDPASIKENQRFVEDLGADELDVVELIMTFEETFELAIPDVDGEKLVTLKDTVKYIKIHSTGKKQVKPPDQPDK